MDQEPRALIKRHNEYVREQVVEDLEALTEKLNVKRQVSETAHNVAHNVVDKAKGTLGMTDNHEVHGVADFVRANAVPLAAVGLGGALLARNVSHMQHSNGNGSHTHDAYGTSTWGDGDQAQGAKARLADKAGSVKDTAASKVDDAKSVVTDKAGAIQGKATEALHGVQDTVTSKLSSAQDTVSDYGTMVGVRASEIKDTVVDKVPTPRQVVRTAGQHGPLLGIAALAIGAIAGAFVPRTKMEEERLAPLQETALETVKETVEGTVDKAKGAVEAGAKVVNEELSGSSESSESSETSDTDDSVEDDSTSMEPAITTPNRITASSQGRTTTNGMPSGSF